VPSDPLVDRLRAAGCVFRRGRGAAAADGGRIGRRARRAGRPPGRGRPAGRRARLGGVLRAADRVDPGVFVPGNARRLWSRRPCTCFGGSRRGQGQVGDGRRAVSWTCVAAPARSGPRVAAAVPDVECTPPTSTPPPSRAPGATCRASTRATSTPRCRITCGGASTCSSSTRRTCPRPPSPPCRRGPRPTSPRVALDGGPDGLDVPTPGRRRRPRLAPSGGALLIETGADQAPHTAELFADAGLVPRVSTPRTRRS
jgi:release factor glutamine methyltransferase